MSFPEIYERSLVGPLFRPFAEMVVERLDPSPGERFLDIASGTGIVARVAHERLGSAGGVVGIDTSADMLAVARSLAPDIDWREGDAARLPLRDGERFDIVVCQQGLQFVPDKRAAAAEMRRALAEGGRLAVETWRSDEEIPFFRELRRVAERRLGPVADQRYGYGDAAPLAALLREAGFRDIEVRTVSRTIRLPEGTPFLRMNAMALVGMSGAGKAMSGDDRKRVLEEIVSESASISGRYADGAELAFELPTNLATAKG